MGRIGNFGKLIVFETSDSRILNFTDYQRTISANWAKHERIGKKAAVRIPQPRTDDRTIQGRTERTAWSEAMENIPRNHKSSATGKSGETGHRKPCRRVEQVEDHTGYPVKPCCYGYWGNPEDGCQSFIGRISVGRAAE